MVEEMTPQEIKEAAQIIEFLEKEIYHAPFHIKKGDHIKVVNDQILFSVVGYSAAESDIKEYLKWENTRFFLRSIVSKLKGTFYHWEIKPLEGELVIVPKKH
jgi:hypothetical protein